jgi:hypothetical protein
MSKDLVGLLEKHTVLGVSVPDPVHAPKKGRRRCEDGCGRLVWLSGETRCTQCRIALQAKRPEEAHLAVGEGVVEFAPVTDEREAAKCILRQYSAVQPFPEHIFDLSGSYE